MFSIILHDIRSSHNVGSIFRTADAAGCKKIYLCGITPAPIDKYNRKNNRLIKVSLGAEKYIPWEKIKSTSHLINKLKKDGYTILAVEQSKKSIPYYNFNCITSCHSERIRQSAEKRRISSLPTRSFAPLSGAQDDKKEKLALILGNEIKGLSPAILKRADKILEIPMRGKKESLNVAVAFGIIAFHLLRDK